MASTTTLTLGQFLADYGAENGYEYWFGEPVRKGMGTKSHSILARVLESLLRACGYDAITEVDLCVDPEWRPRPDVMADLATIERPYPTRPFGIVAEILSPDDRMSRVLAKCRNYVRVGIPRIFLLDPETRAIWEWDRSTSNLERIEELRLDIGTLTAATIWREFDSQR